MNKIEDCNPIPKSAPTMDKVEKSKSKKVIKMGGLWFFITDDADGVTVYSIDLSIQLFWIPQNNSKWDYFKRKVVSQRNVEPTARTRALNMIPKLLKDIKDLNDDN